MDTLTVTCVSSDDEVRIQSQLQNSGVHIFNLFVSLEERPLVLMKIHILCSSAQTPETDECK